MEDTGPSASNILHGWRNHRVYADGKVGLFEGWYKDPPRREVQQDGGNICANVSDGKSRGPPKFVTLLHNIIRGQDLSTGPQKSGMTRNIVIFEALRVFEQKAQERDTETNANF